jgi:hypothetical protein
MRASPRHRLRIALVIAPAQPAPRLGPELGRPDFEPLRKVEQGHDLLIPEYLPLGPILPAERGPALGRARPPPALERPAAPRRRALAGW